MPDEAYAAYTKGEGADVNMMKTDNDLYNITFPIYTTATQTSFDSRSKWISITVGQSRFSL